MNVVRTTCPYCGVGCGVLAQRPFPPSASEALSAEGIEISGDPEHPANHGRLCSKGAALGETLSQGGRLLHPQIRGSRVSWDQALDHVAQGFRRIIDEHGPQSVALYVSGQLLTEDYYVANKLMKGFIGTANIDTNSRLCMSSAVAGHKRAFGEDIVPVCYDDVSEADLIVLVGSNTAWCHPIIFQRITAAKQARPDMKIVVIDPRRTATCEFADVHLPLRAGTDVWLFNGLLAFLEQHGVVDTEFVETHTADAKRALVVVSDCVAQTDTNAAAHVLLPATGWGEKDGTVTNSDRHISRQRAFMHAAGESKPDWWIISQIAQRMGFQGFDFQSPQEIFIEHAQLSALDNAGERAFNIAGLAELDHAAYDALEPIQWPVPY
jgi:assimilatory nitrate reductase catalytic subunit